MTPQFLSRAHRRSVRVPNTLAICSALILFITAMIQPADRPGDVAMLADNTFAREASEPVGEPAVGTVTATDAATTRARPRFRISLMLFRSP